MSVIRITNFGGIRPKFSPRALPDDSAQTAHNLQSCITEFRPALDSTTVVASTGVSNPLTIFRFQLKSDGTLNTNFSSAANWKIMPADINFVKGQVNDDRTDRHFYTYNDGSQPPRWTDATGTDRQLGVPQPTVAPSITVNAGADFTPTDRATALAAARETAIAAVRNNATPVWRGATHPGTGTTGYADQTTANGFAQASDSVMIRAYRLSGVGGTVSNSYCSVSGDQLSWVFDPLLGGLAGLAGATPVWAGGAGTPHYYLSIPAYGLTYDLNTSAISTALTAIAMPGTTDGTKLLTAGQVSEMTAALAAFADPTGPLIKPRLDALAAAVTSARALLDGGARSSLAAATTAFYSKTDVSTEITTAIANVAEAIWNMADGIARSSLPPDYGGAGNAGG